MDVKNSDENLLNFGQSLQTIFGYKNHVNTKRHKVLELRNFFVETEIWGKSANR